eukprot:CAMPEP_0119041244 /NCGR_PEP_ID=MMETSP1177-20130426/11448_1 /TAXON_ID=2985 /ORGANISM="Ochromonas sp, Strain CCMP1899" /LENGTH=234 /DNA_ID=CAMNT_0007007129 /DNA_START=34 /DNA_END=734 /DNA_ORIENTATION=-
MSAPLLALSATSSSTKETSWAPPPAQKDKIVAQSRPITPDPTPPPSANMTPTTSAKSIIPSFDRKFSTTSLDGGINRLRNNSAISLDGADFSGKGFAVENENNMDDDSDDDSFDLKDEERDEVGGGLGLEEKEINPEKIMTGGFMTYSVDSYVPSRRGAGNSIDEWDKHSSKEEVVMARRNSSVKGQGPVPYSGARRKSTKEIAGLYEAEPREDAWAGDSGLDDITGTNEFVLT